MLKHTWLECTIFIKFSAKYFLDLFSNVFFKSWSFMVAFRCPFCILMVDICGWKHSHSVSWDASRKLDNSSYIPFLSAPFSVHFMTLWIDLVKKVVNLKYSLGKTGQYWLTLSSLLFANRATIKLIFLKATWPRKRRAFLNCSHFSVLNQ